MQPLWSRKLAAVPRGLAPARERGWLLAWDADHHLHLFNRLGEIQAKTRAPGDLADACCADDGSRFAAVGTRGEVWLLAPDLTPRCERTVPPPGAAVALDPFGRYAAAADGGGGLSLFDGAGRLLWCVADALALRYVAFVPERPALVGAAAFGLVVCYDFAGRPVWRDAPLAHAGSLTVNGDGAAVALASYTDGLCGYSLQDGTRRCFDGTPCRLASSSYDGDVHLTAGLDHRLRLRDAKGTVRREWTPDAAPVALALSALGEEAYVALADGRITAFRVAP